MRGGVAELLGEPDTVPPSVTVTEGVGVVEAEEVGDAEPVTEEVAVVDFALL